MPGRGSGTAGTPGRGGCRDSANCVKGSPSRCAVRESEPHPLSQQGCRAFTLGEPIQLHRLFIFSPPSGAQEARGALWWFSVYQAGSSLQSLKMRCWNTLRSSRSAAHNVYWELKSGRAHAGLCLHGCHLLIPGQCFLHSGHYSCEHKVTTTSATTEQKREKEHSGVGLYRVTLCSIRSPQHLQE